jgi:hypothetical protein
MPQRRQHISGPAHVLLQLLACASEQLSVESDPGHHHERTAVSRANVQPPVRSGQRHRQCFIQRQGQGEVACEQIPRAAWQHAKRYP